MHSIVYYLIFSKRGREFDDDFKTKGVIQTNDYHHGKEDNENVFPFLLSLLITPQKK